MPALDDFLKKNVADSLKGKVGKGFIAFDVANLVTAENKFKALFQLFKDLVILRAVMAAGFASLFLGMTKGIRTLVHDTGSLEAALKKLSQIQGLQKIFTGLLGSVGAAKLKVAELVNFAATRNIKLGDAGEAARSLSIMTRGSFSSAQALDLVNDAAKATGSSVVDVADAVGTFNAELRSGASIVQATEKLREMGVVSDDVAVNLKQLQENGASAGQVFGALTTHLAGFKAGAMEAAESVESVNEAYEKATVNLQEKFGSPFVAEDVANTKNWTDAMNGVAPSVERVAKFLAVLSGGFSTAKSASAKWAGENKTLTGALEGLIYVLTGTVAVVSAISAYSLSTWLFSAAAGTYAFGVAATTTTGTVIGMTGATLLAASGVGVLVAAVAIAGGVLYTWTDNMDKAAKATQDLQSAQNAADQAMRKQIRNVTTLQQHHEALAKALDAVTQAQKDYDDAAASGDEDAKANMASRLEMVKRTAELVKRQGTLGLSAGPVEAAKAQAEIERKRESKEQAFQDRLSLAKPEEKSKLLADRLKELQARVDRGKRDEGVTVRADAFKNSADNRLQIAQKEFEAAQQRASGTEAVLNKATESAPEERTAEDERYITELSLEHKKALQNLRKTKVALATAQAFIDKGFEAPDNSEEGFLQRKAKVLASTDPNRGRKADELQRGADEARRNRLLTTENELDAMRTAADKKALDREILLGKMAIQNEAAIQDARLRGDSAAEQRLGDLNVFAEKYQQMIEAGFSAKDSEKGAATFASNAISLDSRNTGADGQVADSLARIGGGGGVGGPSGDPLLTAAQRLNDLQESALEYLKTISEAGSKGVL